MGKHEPMDPKAIANRQKAKGLQKLAYYCQMCQKQCRDDNGFKCHTASESHQRQLLLFADNPDKFLSDFSKDFKEGFMYLLKTQYGTKRVLANTVYQDYIKERDHIHMNATHWTTLTDFANWLGRNSLVKVDHNERGVYITYIDRDPDTLRRQEMNEKKEKQLRDNEDYVARTIKKQIQLGKKLDPHASTSAETTPKPVPFVIVSKDSDSTTTPSTDKKEPETDAKEEGLVFEFNNFQAIHPSGSDPSIEAKPLFQIEPIKLSITNKSTLLKRPATVLRPPNFVKKLKLKKK